MTALPPGWVMRPLSTLVSEVRMAVTPAPGTKYELWSVPSFADRRPERIDGSAIGSAKRRVQPGDVLLCKINPRINRVWLVGETPSEHEPIASPEWMILRTPRRNAALHSEYLRHYLSSPIFRDWIASAVSGVTGSHTRAKAGPILQQVVPVPPLNEQRRIVDILEDHLSRLDAGLASLRNVSARITSLRESWLSEQLGDPPKMQLYRLGDCLADCRGGWSRSQKHLVAASKGVPYLKMNNISRSGALILDDVVHVEADADALCRYGIRAGDLLFNSKNSGDLVGKTAVATEAMQGWTFNENIMRLRFDQRFNPAFVGLWFLAPIMRQSIMRAASASTNVAAVYKHHLVEMPLWLPELATQHRLVGLFDDVAAGAVRLRSQISLAASRSAGLRRSLLVAAFSGRLTGGSIDMEMVEEMAGV